MRDALVKFQMRPEKTPDNRRYYEVPDNAETGNFETPFHVMVSQQAGSFFG
jgi:hypothetical protein